MAGPGGRGGGPDGAGCARRMPGGGPAAAGGGCNRDRYDGDDRGCRVCGSHGGGPGQEGERDDGDRQPSPLLRRGAEYVYRHSPARRARRCGSRCFVPPQAASGKVPVVWFLSGLTCTEDNFTAKAGAQRVAAELGLMLIAPDTSPAGGRGRAGRPGLRFRHGCRVLCGRHPGALGHALPHAVLHRGGAAGVSGRPNCQRTWRGRRSWATPWAAMAR